ncbi:putative E3 ubiquitin-protein ligase RNF103 [Scophthalmus maximus]|uniref:Putative E3 ubiquitin-protein ligase RNF103 n=2 Tax=Scophthalmus maximus TaxID=52904 RepID=A0A2U9C7P2_SCOMX|nr:E3 ubiquitin-protein ligase RNF103 isoform X1 [Scophthalmus maximus]AWP12611.1 putative E3 ubiquitin-protein ligase RNF103 [Scophthalmus maximus]
MWLKLFFLLLYFMVLFLLARIFEAVVWYETGVFANQLVNPVTLSYERLKTILECRGLGYPGLAEKEVSELVEKSGELTQGELYSAIKKEKEQTEPGDSSTTHFSGEMHFYEFVEDTKDGIWLVQVIAQDQEALLSKSNWGKMVQKVSQFGIRTGTFNCSNDYRSCIKRGWQHSTLIMSVPQTSASKGKVMLKEYNGCHNEIEHIFRWMTSHVAHRIKTLRQSEQLVEEWRFDPAHPVKMFLFARLSQPPAFFSSLSIKFTGRIEFIFVDVSHWDNHSSLKEIGVTHSPAYIFKMPEGIYRYGNSTGEFLSLAAMDTFLRSVQPEVNDLFVLSLVLINLLAWMDLFITQGATVKRFVVLIRTLGTYNSILLVSWLPVLALLQLPYLDTLYGYSLKLLRYADTTTLASLVRADWTFYSSHPALFLSTYLAHGLLVDLFEKKRRCGIRSREESTTNLEWLASLWDSYTSYLLHPIASLQQVPTDHSDWEDDPNFLFERLAFPDLWLHPLVNVDYIKTLPTWRFRAVGQQHGGSSGVQPHEETESYVSDTDNFPHTGPSTPQNESERHKRSLSSKNSSTQLCLYSNMEPSSNHLCVCDRAVDNSHLTPPAVSNQQHCDWLVWPCDMLQCSECVVCLENFVSEELLMGLPCGHAFHQQCIVVWLAAGRHCCPVCRWPSYKKKQQRGAKINSAENTLQD